MTSIPHFPYTTTGLVGSIPWPDVGNAQTCASNMMHFSEAIRPALAGRNCEGCGAPLRWDGFHTCRYCGRGK